LKRYLLLLLALPLIRLVYGLSRLVPKSPKLWVVGSQRNTFSDNSKYFYYYFLRQAQSEPALGRIVWITGSRQVHEQLRELGCPVAMRWSLRGCLLALRAKNWVISASIADINFMLSGGAKVLNLWHGIPLKKIEFDIQAGPLHSRYHRPNFVERHVDHVMLLQRTALTPTSGKVVEQRMCSALRIDVRQSVRCGFPRLQQLVPGGEALPADWHGPQFAALQYRLRSRAYYIYMPTWRDASARRRVDYGLLDDWFRLQGTLLVVKLHFLDTSGAESLRDNKFSNILLYEGQDMYPVLAGASGLITDYSSIFYDYLLLDRPLYFFAFDLEEYVSKSRDLYSEFMDSVPGPVVRGELELTRALMEPDVHRERRRALKEEYLGWQRTDATVVLARRMLGAGKHAI
jgi:CDP-glycerol glycerophosphotransferase (TagB/SpsB family)